MVFDLVESAKMDLFRSTAAVLLGGPAVPQPAPAPAPAPPSAEPEPTDKPGDVDLAKLASDDAICSSTPEAVLSAVQGFHQGATAAAKEMLVEIKEEVVEQQDNNQFSAQFIDRMQRDMDSLKKFIRDSGLQVPKL
jgi:hypothetical protein